MLKLCGKKDNPTPLPLPPPLAGEDSTEVSYGTQTPVAPLPIGDTRRFKSIVPEPAVPGALAGYYTGSLNVYMSVSPTKPAAGSADSTTQCHDTGVVISSETGCNCGIGEQPGGTIVYAWVVNTAAVDMTFFPNLVIKFNKMLYGYSFQQLQPLLLDAIFKKHMK